MLLVGSIRLSLVNNFAILRTGSTIIAIQHAVQSGSLSKYWQGYFCHSPQIAPEQSLWMSINGSNGLALLRRCAFRNRLQNVVSAYALANRRVIIYCPKLNACDNFEKVWICRT